jgi:hypothetical protein
VRVLFTHSLQYCLDVARSEAKSIAVTLNLRTGDYLYIIYIFLVLFIVFHQELNVEMSLCHFLQLSPWEAQARGNASVS